jgi:preprotein translocase subunit SecA
MNHLDEIDYLREGIGLRGYGQRDPLIEYKREAFSLFSSLMENVRSTIVRTIFRVAAVPTNQIQEEQRNLQFKGADLDAQQFASAKQMQNSEGGSPKEEVKQKPIINQNKVGRNDPCPCGSGKKYKKCCGK